MLQHINNRAIWKSFEKLLARFPDILFTAVKHENYVTSGCQCLENLYQLTEFKPFGKFVRKHCQKYTDKTKYEAVKSVVIINNTQRLKLHFPVAALPFDIFSLAF